MLVFSEHPILMSASTKHRLMSILHLSTEIIKKTRTGSGNMMAMAYCTTTSLLRTDSCFYRLLSAFFWSFSVAITTYVYTSQRLKSRLTRVVLKYIAKKLFEINERGTFTDPAALSPEQLKAQDEEIFQTARLVNCGWFGSVVFSDYFSCILGLVRTGSNWSLSPFGVRLPALPKRTLTYISAGFPSGRSLDF